MGVREGTCEGKALCELCRCWLSCLLNPFTRNYRSHMKTKAKVADIWCHLMHKMKLERCFPIFLSRWCMRSSCLDNIWIIKHLIWEAQTSSHWHQPVQTPQGCREHLHIQGRDRGRISVWEQPGEGWRLYVQCVPHSHSSGTKPDLWVETPWPCLNSLSRSSPRQSK